MAYTPTWKKNLILFCGLLENLVFTGNILGWGALNHMLKNEGVYENYCFNEIILAPSNSNQTFLLANNSNSLLSAKLNNETLLNIPEYITELPSLNITNKRDYELNDEEEEHRNEKEDTTLPTDDIEINTEPNDGLNSESINNKIKVPLTTLPSLVRTKRADSNKSENNSENRTNRVNFLNDNHIPFTTKRNCKKQDTILNLAYTFGTFLNGFTAFVWGFLLDKYGLRKVRLLINFFLSAGCALLCFTSRDNPHFIFPAVSLLCLGGVPLRIADMQFSNLYPKIRSSIITLYSGAFSASSIVFVVIKYVYDHGFEYYYATSLLFFTSLLILPVTFLLLPTDTIKEDDDKPIPNKKDPTNHAAFIIENKNIDSDKKSKDADNYCKENEIKFSRQKFNRIYEKNFNKIQPIKLEKFQYIGSPKLKRKESDSLDSVDKSAAPVELDAKIMVNSNAVGLDNLDAPLKKLDNSNEKKKTGQLPLKLSLLSLPYIVHQYWFCWLITFIIMYVGSMNLWIQRITEDVGRASFYLKIYGLLQVFSLIIAPLAGAIMDYNVNKANKEKDPFNRKLKMAKAGFWPITITNLSLVGVIISKFFDHEIAIYISIILNTFLRSFLIAVASAYLRIRFAPEHFNKLLGIMSTIGAILSLIQFPLFIIESYPDNVIWVNLFNSFMTLLAFSNSFLIIYTPLQKKIIMKQQKLESLYKN